MDNDLADLSFLNSDNLGLADNMDVLQVMQMALQTEPVEAGHLAPPAGADSAAPKAANEPTPLSGCPEMSLDPAQSAPAPSGSQQTASAASAGPGQVTPASALLDQLLSASLQGGPVPSLVTSATGYSVVRPAPSQATVMPSQTTVVPSRTTAVPSRTTVVPSQTTVVPSRTTAVPSRTTVVSSQTTVLPSQATEGARQNTAAPSQPVVVPGQAGVVSAAVPPPVEVVTGGPLPVITIGGKARAGAVQQVTARRRPHSKIVIVKPKPQLDSTSSIANVGKKVIVVGSKAIPRPGGQQITSPGLQPAPAVGRLAVPAAGAPPRPPAAPVPSSGAGQKLSLAGVRAQLMVVDGKERVVLYRQQGAPAPSSEPAATPTAAAATPTSAAATATTTPAATPQANVAAAPAPAPAPAPPGPAPAPAPAAATPMPHALILQTAANVVIPTTCSVTISCLGPAPAPAPAPSATPRRILPGPKPDPKPADTPAIKRATKRAAKRAVIKPAAKPDAAKTDAKTDAAKPDTAKSDTAKSAAKPDAAKPTAKADTAKHAKPDAIEPAAKPNAEPDSIKPAANSDATKPATKPAVKLVVTKPAANSDATKPATKPAVKLVVTKPAAKPDATEPAAKPDAAEPAAKPSGWRHPGLGGVINVRIANGSVTTCTTGGQAGRRPAVRTLQRRLERAAEPFGAPVHMVRSLPVEDTIVVDDLPTFQRGERIAMPCAAKMEPAAKPPVSVAAPAVVVASGGRRDHTAAKRKAPSPPTGLVSGPAEAVLHDHTSAKKPTSATSSVDRALQEAVSAIFDCVDEAAETGSVADPAIESVVRQVEGGGEGSEAWSAAESPLLARVLRRADDQRDASRTPSPPQEESKKPRLLTAGRAASAAPSEAGHTSGEASASGESSQRAGGESPQRAGGESSQRAGGESSQRAGGESPQRAGGESSQRAGGESSQRAGGESPQRAGGESSQRAGGESSQRAGARQRRRKDILRPLQRTAEPVPAPPPAPPPAPSPTTPPAGEPAPEVIVPPRLRSQSPSPERKPITGAKALVELIEDLCTMDGLSWTRSGFADLVRKKKKEEMGMKDPQLYLNEFGLVEVVDRAARSALVVGQGTPSEDSSAGGADRRPDSICCCTVCGCFGCLADFYGDGAFCSRVCYDVATGRAAIKKKKTDLIERKKRILAEIEDEEKLPLKRVALPKDSQRLVYGADSRFSWSRYLETLGRMLPAARAAPELTADPPGPALFRAGQRLEAVDPRRPTLICAGTVAEVVGSRLRVHFDGYSVRFDFWVESASRDIFPCGWTERHWSPECSVQPPRGRDGGTFSWPAYLRHTGAVAAPDNCFACVADQEVPYQRVETELRVGHCLEAADPAHPRHMRPARVARLRSGRLLVEFDGSEPPAGFWAELSSPRLRPVAWAEENDVPILPPEGWGDKPFQWQTYLVDTRSLPVPARLFRTRQTAALKPGMRLEAVDVRVPALVRVMHVQETSRHGLVRLRPDGWAAAQDQWVPLDGGGLHRPGWSRLTGHPLTPPVTGRQTAAVGCRTDGCTGLGHAGGPRYRRHCFIEQCPYTARRPATPDRLHSDLTEEDDLSSLEWPERAAAAVGGRRSITLSRDLSSIASEVTSSVFDREPPRDDRRVVWPRCERLRRVDRFLAEHRAVHLWGADTVLQFLQQFGTADTDPRPLQTFVDEEIDGEAMLLLTRADLGSLMRLSLGTAAKVHSCIVRLRKHFNYRGQQMNASGAPT